MIPDSTSKPKFKVGDLVKYAVIGMAEVTGEGRVLAVRPSWGSHTFTLEVDRADGSGPIDIHESWCSLVPEPAPTNEVEEAVIEEIRKRRDAGRKKYGTSMERTDLSISAWVQHAKEEALDFAIYLEKLRREVEERDRELVSLRARVEELEATQIWEFGEDEIPSFHTGPLGKHELTELVTAKRCAELVKIITTERERNARLVAAGSALRSEIVAVESILNDQQPCGRVTGALKAWDTALADNDSAEERDDSVKLDGTEGLGTFGGESRDPDFEFAEYGLDLGKVSVYGVTPAQAIQLACTLVDHLSINGHDFELRKGRHQDQRLERVCADPEGAR